jgi:sugar (pentulose or hexulose) kinase
MTKDRADRATLLGIDVGISGLKVILLDAADATVDGGWR